MSDFTLGLLILAAMVAVPFAVFGAWLLFSYELDQIQQLLDKHEPRPWT